jgi:hypothetical protein
MPGVAIRKNGQGLICDGSDRTPLSIGDVSSFGVARRFADQAEINAYVVAGNRGGVAADWLYMAFPSGYQGS